MFPFAIINSFGSKLEKEFLNFAKKINQKIFYSLEKSNINDAILDSSPLEILAELRNRQGEYINSEDLKNFINSNLNILDAWAVSQINNDLEKERELLRASGVSEEQLDRRIPLIPKNDVYRLNKIPLASKKIQLLQNQAYAEYFNEVEDILTEGIIHGKKAEEITKNILDKVSIKAGRARFWAEDQASLFHAEQYRVASIRGGYTHYEWENNGSNVRPSHAIHNRKVVSWNVGVNNLTRPGARHAGEDYKCHCTPKNLSAEQLLKRGYTNPNIEPRQPQSLEGLLENYFGSEDGRLIKGSDAFSFLTDTLLGNLTQSYRVSVMTATNEMNQVIDMDKIYMTYPIQFQSFPEDSSFVSKASGAYTNSNIFINEKSTNAVLTVIHETAHHLEEKVLAKGVPFLNTLDGKVFLSEIKKMDSYKKLLNSKNIPNEILHYYSKDKEVFSRIMEQYFAKKRGGEIQRQFLKSRKFKSLEYSIDLYFSEDEFLIIEKLIDSIFQKRGLMK